MLLTTVILIGLEIIVHVVTATYINKKKFPIQQVFYESMCRLQSRPQAIFDSVFEKANLFLHIVVLALHIKPTEGEKKGNSLYLKEARIFFMDEYE